MAVRPRHASSGSSLKPVACAWLTVPQAAPVMMSLLIISTKLVKRLDAQHDAAVEVAEAEVAAAEAAAAADDDEEPEVIELVANEATDGAEQVEAATEEAEEVEEAEESEGEE